MCIGDLHTEKEIFMSSTYVVIVLCIVVALLILMVGKLKFHAILALLIATITLGILVGTPLEKIPSTLNSGFGSTCTSVALVIFLGSLLGLILSETGAIVKLTTSLVDFCGKKRVLWAIGTSACILGIPVFPDTVSLLTIPLCTNLAQQTGISMMAFAAVIQVSIVTSSLVPPTPGPVAGAATLGLSLGEAIPWGILVSIPGLIATVLYASTLKNEHVELNANFLNQEDTKDKITMSLIRAILPFVVPVLLIVGQTVTGVLLPGTIFASVMNFIGAPLSALIIGCFLAVFLQVKEWWKREDVRNDWISKAVIDCAGPVFITALGGSLAAFIKSAGVAETLANLVVSAHIPGIFVPMLIGILIRIVTGSNTLAVTTSAALCQPMLETLGVSTLAAYLAMCSGGIAFSHANSSGFWLTCSLSNLDFKQGLRSVGGSTLIGGLACCAMTLVLYFTGII